jgi:hypothetical protein
MSDTPPTQGDYLVISRGKWDPAKSPEEIQQAIDRFYVWYEQAVAAGRMKRGQRLAVEGKVVTRERIVAEAKELVGGYCFIVAASLDEATALAAENPCIACGLTLEIRPLELERASAYAVTNENR